MGEAENKGKKRIKKRTIYAIILSVMLICFVMIGFLLLFQVREINVQGTQYLTKQEVARWIQRDDFSSNSIYLMWKYRFSDYDLLPAMEDVEVKLKNPWTVNVMVSEKKIAGYIIVGEEYVYFDRDGIVLAQTTEWWEDIPCIEGITVNDVSLFAELPVSDDNKKAFRQLLDMSATLRKYELKPDRIMCQESNLYLYFGNKCVIIGHENLSDRIAQIAPIFEKLGEQGGTLHLENYDEGNTTISFEKDVLPPEPQANDNAADQDGAQQ